MTGSSEGSGQDVDASPYETGSRESSQERKEKLQDLQACGTRGFHSQSGEELREKYSIVTGRSFADVETAFDSASRSSSQEDLVQLAAVMLSDIHVSPWIFSWAYVIKPDKKQQRSPSPTRPRSPVFRAEPSYHEEGMPRDLRTMYPRNSPEWEYPVPRTYSPTDEYLESRWAPPDSGRFTGNR
jgi:hypothetical protein